MDIWIFSNSMFLYREKETLISTKSMYLIRGENSIKRLREHELTDETMSSSDLPVAMIDVHAVLSINLLFTCCS